MKTTYKLQQTNRDRDNSRHVRTHEKNLLRCVRRLGTIIQSIFCAQSGAGIRLNFWKWSVESPAFSPDPTDCPWVSEDEPSSTWTLEMLYVAHTLDACLMPKFHRNRWEEFRDILEALKNGCKLCMNWRLDFMPTNWLLFGCFRKILSLVRCSNDPCALYNFEEHENMRVGVERDAVLFL